VLPDTNRELQTNPASKNITVHINKINSTHIDNQTSDMIYGNIGINHGIGFDAKIGKLVTHRLVFILNLIGRKMRPKSKLLKSRFGNGNGLHHSYIYGILGDGYPIL
jgi:hypothetical protein